ncbi:secreted protein [Moniliophthora roreri MCA 2997]|uniref:Secreted protein n=1 Tax=Moniliophthora roreri (strain MCA 2997) TaxID=1381753 RepID=V2WYT2_MONRO|nr:secreted protein [Moniliophthora roreri MCA 2997]
MIARLSFILAIAVALLLLPEISVGRALQARRHMKRFTPDKREPCVGLGCWYGGIGISGPEHKHKHNKHPHHDHTSTSKNSGSDQEVYLNLHNELRAQHGASQLTWNKTLEHAAQEWADRCIFEHSQGELGELGENLSAGVGKDFDAAAAVQLWIDEAGDYNPSNPEYSHFTQMVWKGSTCLGCAKATNCGGIFGDQPATLYVCEYWPPGNVIGYFASNIQV